jgi:hypothetical protein
MKHLLNRIFRPSAPKETPEDRKARIRHARIENIWLCVITIEAKRVSEFSLQHTGQGRRTCS